MTWKDRLGQGVYSVPEAARLTGVSAARIRRWVQGYEFPGRSGKHRSPAIWKPDLPKVEGMVALSFRDLMEVRFVDAYLKHGLTWRVIRLAAESAAEIVNSDHPFTTRRFKTDGCTIFTEFAAQSGESALLDLVRRQYAIFEVVNPHLFESLEFGPGDEVAKWYPRWPDTWVVVDPHLSFGQPVVRGTRMPTAFLVRAVEAEGSVDRVAELYQLDPAGVEAAVDFERRAA